MISLMCVPVRWLAGFYISKCYCSIAKSSRDAWGLFCWHGLTLISAWICMMSTIDMITHTSLYILPPWLIGILWIPQHLVDDWSTLVQVTTFSIRQAAIACASIDQDFCRHMESLGLNEQLSEHKIWSNVTVSRWLFSTSQNFDCSKNKCSQSKMGAVVRAWHFVCYKQNIYAARASILNYEWESVTSLWLSIDSTRYVINGSWAKVLQGVCYFSLHKISIVSGTTARSRNCVLLPTHDWHFVCLHLQENIAEVWFYELNDLFLEVIFPISHKVDCESWFILFKHVFLNESYPGHQNSLHIDVHQRMFEETLSLIPIMPQLRKYIKY